MTRRPSATALYSRRTPTKPKSEPLPRPILPETVTKRDISTCFPALTSDQDGYATLMLMQMIADTYEDIRQVWDTNRQCIREEGDGLSIYGPNSAQRKVEEFLVSWRYLARAAPPQKTASHAPEVIVKKNRHSSRWFEPEGRVDNEVRDVLQTQLKMDAQRRKRALDTSLPSPPIHKPARSAPSRIVLSRTLPLRCMTSADTYALIASSVRQKRARLQNDESTMEIYVAPELHVPSFKGVDYEALLTIRWPDHRPQPESPLPAQDIPAKKLSQTEDDEGEEKDIPVPLYTTLILILLVQFCIISFVVIGILYGLYGRITDLAMIFSYDDDDEG